MVHDYRKRIPGYNMKLGSRPKTIHEPVRNAGAKITSGSVVILDYANMTDNSEVYVTTTTVAGHPLTYGIAVGDISATADGGTGFVCVAGPAEVALKGATVNIAAGDRIITGAVAGYGYKATTTGGKAVGFALDAKAADSVLGTEAGYATVYVDCCIGASVNDGVIADPGAGQAIPVTASGLVNLVSGAVEETRSLALPTIDGQRMTVAMKTFGGGNIILTVAGGYDDQAGHTHLLFTGAGQTVELVASASGAGLVWNLAWNPRGVALN